MTKSEISAVVEAVVAALEEQNGDSEPEAPKEIKTQPKAVKRPKAQNKVLWRQVQGKIRKAGNANTKVLAKGFLKEAQKMTPLSWTSVHAQIITKGKALGVKGLAA